MIALVLFAMASLAATQMETRQELNIAVLSSVTGDYTIGEWLPVFVPVVLSYINNDPDFLPGYYLNASYFDSGCSKTKALEAFRSALHPNNHHVGIFGPACSAAAEPVAIAAPYAGKHQISGTASMSFLHNRETFPNFFRTIPVESTSEMVDFTYHMGWRSVALVGGNERVADSRRAQDRASTLGVTLISFSLIFPVLSECQGDDPSASCSGRQGRCDATAQQLIDDRVRVVMVSAWMTEVKCLMCSRFRLNVGAEDRNNVVWVTWGWFEDFWYTQEIGLAPCSAVEVGRMVSYSFGVGNRLRPQTSAQTLTCAPGLNSTAFLSSLSERLEDYQMSFPELVFILDGLCLWAVALRTFLLERGGNVEDLWGAMDTEHFDQMHEIISSASFVSMQSEDFSLMPGTGHPMGTYAAYQYQPLSDGTCCERMDVLEFEGESTFHLADARWWDGQERPGDFFPEALDPMAIITIVVSGCFLALVIGILLIWYFRNRIFDVLDSIRHDIHKDVYDAEKVLLPPETLNKLSSGQRGPSTTMGRLMSKRRSSTGSKSGPISWLWGKPTAEAEAIPEDLEAGQSQQMGSTSEQQTEQSIWKESFPLKLEISERNAEGEPDVVLPRKHEALVEYLKILEILEKRIRLRSLNWFKRQTRGRCRARTEKLPRLLTEHEAQIFVEVVSIVRHFLKHYHEAVHSNDDMLQFIRKEAKDVGAAWEMIYRGVASRHCKADVLANNIGGNTRTDDGFFSWSFPTKSFHAKPELDEIVTIAERSGPRPEQPSKEQGSAAIMPQISGSICYSDMRLVVLIEEAARCQLLLNEFLVGLTAGSSHTFTVMKGKLKGTYRTIEKAFFEKSDPMDSLDLARAGVRCQDMDGLQELLVRFQTKHKAEAIHIHRVKDRFKNPTETGWRDILVNFSIGSGAHICEVQLIHEKMFCARTHVGGHQDYNRHRTFDAVSALPVTTPDTTDPGDEHANDADFGHIFCDDFEADATTTALVSAAAISL